MQTLCALVAVTAAALLILGRSTHAYRIDCRKFVFAPRCRGVAAKRASAGLAVVDDADYGGLPTASDRRHVDAYPIEGTDADSWKYSSAGFTKSPQLHSKGPHLAAPTLSWGDLLKLSLRMRQSERGSEHRTEGLTSSKVYRPTAQSTQDYLEALLQHLNSERK